MARYLITGGAGFIGSHLVRGALKRGHEPVVLDDFSTGRWQNLDGLTDRVTVVEGSLLDPKAVDRALDGVVGVFHQAAVPSVPTSIDEPLRTHHANLTGTLELLEGCRRADVKRLIYAASSSAYGDHDVESTTEELIPRPKSPYAVQKLGGEHYCRVYHEVFGIQTIGLRYFNVFGPGQDPKGQYAAVVPAFITRMLRGEPPTIFGDGRQSRDFTFIDNVVAANFAALDAPDSAFGRVYNAACGHSIDLIELVAQINAALGTDVKPVHEPARVGDILRSQADISAATAALGYRPHVSVEEGLAQTVRWFRDHPVA